MYTENVAVYIRSRFLLIIQKLDRISVWSSSIVGQKAVLAVQIITVKVMKKFLERMALLRSPWQNLDSCQKRFHKQPTRSRRYCYCFLGPSSSKGGYLYPLDNAIGFTCIVHRIVIYPVDGAFTESRRLKEASIVFYYCSQRLVYRWF